MDLDSVSKKTHVGTIKETQFPEELKEITKKTFRLVCEKNCRYYSYAEIIMTNYKCVNCETLIACSVLRKSVKCVQNL